MLLCKTFTFGGRGSRFFSSAGSLVVAAGLAAAAGFFFVVAAGFAVVDGLGVSSSFSATASDFDTVELDVFFVIVAELIEDVVVFDGAAAAAALAPVGADERGSPRRLSRTAFSAYSLI